MLHKRGLGHCTWQYSTGTRTVPCEKTRQTQRRVRLCRVGRQVRQYSTQLAGSNP
ncbi:hypothetical protein PGT21_017688 [Puccinia graminis f. sp. tritici]|uniref:Uncharacterized protein n=1 Tax=Puccinia graminis f. sp. tritici TaxID=56615 RepID=A0A5B0MN88_PUCGR|nr:hypothetical protein PGT21_017688 [Puccinia graminis f. sp. tritici]